MDMRHALVWILFPCWVGDGLARGIFSPQTGLAPSAPNPPIPHHAATRSTFVQDLTRGGCAAFLLTAADGIKPAVAEATSGNKGAGSLFVVDEKLGWTVEIPSQWSTGTPEKGLSSRRRIVAFSGPDGANAFVAYTPVKADYTSLSAMGSLDELSSLVLPANREGVASVMLDERKISSSYYYDYKVEVDGEPVRRTKTVWTLLPESSVLVTLAVQAREDSMGTLGTTLDGIISSYLDSMYGSRR